MSTPDSKKRPLSGKDADDEEAPDHKRSRSDEEVQVLEIVPGPDISENLYNFFRLFGTEGVWHPRLAAFLPFWYDCVSYQKKTFAEHCINVRDWVEAPAKRMTRPNTAATLVGLDADTQKLLFLHPRDPHRNPLTATFRVSFGVPETVPTSVFPYLTPTGGIEQLRDAKALNAACMGYLRKAITTYCLPKTDKSRVFVKAGGWRITGNGTTRVVSGKNSWPLHLTFKPDPVTGNLSLICYARAINDPLSMEELFTPAVIYNIKLVLEAYNILAQLPRELRLASKRFAPQLSLEERFAKEGDF
jgi:hypothetical protein